MILKNSEKYNVDLNYLINSGKNGEYLEVKEYNDRMRDDYELWIKKYNTRFFYGRNGEITVITEINELDKIVFEYNDYKLYC